MTQPACDWQPADPFDLPEWLGQDALTWVAEHTLSSVQVVGMLTSAAGQQLPLDLLCVDAAFPAPVVCERVRHDAHQAWHYGQVLLLGRAGRTALGVPKARIDADLSCDALRRFAKAIGVRSDRVSVTLRL
ncbi:MAG: hypothetical protein M3419_05215 [Actinomycetota bacterium]|nr:hypothetical protein [Actinomycetota bacterium]